jgi:hypothetical protein
LGFLGAASVADASPITYTFTGGSATLTATVAGFGTIAVGTVPLTGTQVTFDTGPPAKLNSFLFTAGPAGPLPLSGIFSGVSVTLASLSIAPGGGYTSTASGPSPNPGTYTYNAQNIAVNGVASLSGLVTTGPTAFGTNNPFLSGQVVVGGLGTLGLNGITLGTLPIPAIPAIFFPGGTATLKADVLFTGIVPEPGTALLLAAGLATLAASRRSRL